MVPHGTVVSIVAQAAQLDGDAAEVGITARHRALVPVVTDDRETGLAHASLAEIAFRAGVAVIAVSLLLSKDTSQQRIT